LDVTDKNIGEAIEVFITNNKKGYIGISMIPPAARKQKTEKKSELKGEAKEK
jgi:hypothetical protein